MSRDYYKHFEKIIYHFEDIERAIIKAANWIDDEYKDVKEEIVLIGLLKGCIPFLGRLLLHLNHDVILDFMVVSSFKGEDKRIGEPSIITDIITDIKDKHILLIEDIVDSGYTIKKIIELLKKRQPKSIKLISLLDKREGRRVNVKIDYSCLKIPNEFIVGFGLDYKEKCRNWDCIGIPKKNYIKGEKNE